VDRHSTVTVTPWSIIEIDGKPFRWAGSSPEDEPLVLEFHLVPVEENPPDELRVVWT